MKKRITTIIDAKEEIAKLKNPNCAEDDVFFQAMEEVLLSIFPLFKSDEMYAKSAKNAIVRRLIMLWGHTKAVYVSIHRSMRGSSSSSVSSRSLKMPSQACLLAVRKGEATSTLKERVILK